MSNQQNDMFFETKNEWEEEQMEEKNVVSTNNGWKPTPIEEDDIKEFDEAIRGKYDCEIKDLIYKTVQLKTGEQKDIISMRLQCVKDLEGDISRRRMLDKAYWLGASEFTDDPEYGFKSLLNDLASSNLYDESMVNSGDMPATIVKIKQKIVGKIVYVSAFPKKDKQQVRIYKRKDSSETPVIKGVF